MVCAWVVDAHIHKNGGTSLRNFVLKNEIAGHIAYSGFEARTFHIKKECAQWSNSTGALFREVHRGDDFKTVVHAITSINAQRPHAGLPPCKLITIVRIRNPMEMYASFFKWAFAYSKDLPDYKSFVARYPNIQSNLLVDPEASFYYEKNIPRVGRKISWRLVRNILDRATYALTTDNLNALILILSKRLSIPAIPYALGIARRTRRFERFNFSEHEIHAPLDWMAYRFARKRFQMHKARISSAEIDAYTSAIRKYNIDDGKKRRERHKEQMCSYRALYDAPRHPMCDDQSALCDSIRRHRNFDCPWKIRTSAS